MSASPDLEKRQQENPDQHKSTQTAPLPLVSGYLPLVLGGSHWHGQGSLKNIVVFGDSYSQFYGSVSWVNHLQQLLPEPPKIHDYAVPGATAGLHLESQIKRFFSEFPEPNDSEPSPSLDPDDTTYCVYLGINDCGGRGDDVLDIITTKLFDTLRDLYVKAKARNFVLIDVPPFQHTPMISEMGWSKRVAKDVTTWNKHLGHKATTFQSNADDTTLLLFSSHAFFKDLLDEPSKYGFSEEDTKISEGAIWFDDLHPTSKVHEVLAKEIYASIFDCQKGEVGPS